MANICVLSIDRSTDPQNQVYVREASAAADAPWTELIGDFENQFSFVGNEGKKFFFLTDLNAPTKRIVAMDIDQPGREHVTEIIPAQKGTLDGASILSGRILAQYLVDVLTEIKVFDLDGKSLGEVQRPGFGSVHGFSGDQDDTETFYVYTSYNTPARIYRYDVMASESQLIREPSLKFDPEKFEVEQVFYNSKDGTRVPMMLAYLKAQVIGASRVDFDAGHPPDAALRLWRLQHFAYAGLQPGLHRLDGNGRHRGGG